MFAASLENIRDDPTRVHGLFLYGALEELHVLRDFAAHDYRCHPEYNQCAGMHLFDMSLPCLVYTRSHLCLSPLTKFSDDSSYSV